MRTFILIFLTSLNFSLFGKIRQFTFNEQCEKATEIFTGRVISLTILKEWFFEQTSFKTYRITFVTDKLWKGSIFDTMTCIAKEGICAQNNFELGKKYLVYSDNGEIDLGAGRSWGIQYYFIKSDMRKLNRRYLFRRPTKKTIDKRMTFIYRTRQPITAGKPNGGRRTSLPCD